MRYFKYKNILSDITYMNIEIFNGGWSYTNLEMKNLFNHIDITKEYDSYNIIEFGAGDSSEKIYSLFKNVKKLQYYIVESNTTYLPENTNNKYKIILYDENNIMKISLNTLIQPILFDLILIDGPNGESRKYWYNKIKNYVKPGSIILVDDFNHYESFSEELDKNYDYELLSFSNIPFAVNGEHSWKIVKVTNIK